MDGGQAVGQIQIGQSGTVAEGVAVNGGHTAAKADRFKIGTAIKSIGADADHCVGEQDALQRGVLLKDRIADGLDGVAVDGSGNHQMLSRAGIAGDADKAAVEDAVGEVRAEGFASERAVQKTGLGRNGQTTGVGSIKGLRIGKGITGLMIAYGINISHDCQRGRPGAGRTGGAMGKDILVGGVIHNDVYTGDTIAGAVFDLASEGSVLNRKERKLLVIG